MNKGLVDIHFHGPLAEKYGAHHRLSVMTPREAVHAMNANYPGFLADFAQHERYGVLVDDDWRDGEDAAILPCSKTIHFYPVIEGNVPLVAMGLTAAFGLGATAATIVGSLLVLGLMVGLSFLFKPKQPKKEKEEKDESYAFSGPENVTGQGVAVPVIYGRVYAGSVVVSAGQDTVDVETTTKKKANKKPSSGSSNNDSTPPPAWRERSSLSHGEERQPRGMPREDVIYLWPDLVQEGAGVDQYLDPPVEGYPPIIPDSVYGFRPEGWVPVKVIWATEEDDENRKQVMVWQPDYETMDYVYNWNMVRGFYATPVGMEAEEDEWIDGADMEVPIEDPAP